MRFTVTAPNRIDLAGGTTDLYPLYLFMEGGFTVNIAINVFSRVHFETVQSSVINIVSEDLRLELTAVDSEKLPITGPLGLVARAVKAFPPPTGLKITTHNEAPCGSGLGASSALLIALLKGLDYLRSDNLSAEKLLSAAVALESAAIGVPAGSQDHIAALFGGISLIKFGYFGFERTSIESSRFLESFYEQIILTYTGESRFSGTTNWDVVKAYIDDEGSVREILESIRDTAVELGKNFKSGHFSAAPECIQREWELRRKLAPGVTTPRIENLISAASKEGAKANKICGAGGGGCMITLADPSHRENVSGALKKAGADLMSFQVCSHGAVIDL